MILGITVFLELVLNNCLPFYHFAVNGHEMARFVVEGESGQAVLCQGQHKNLQHESKVGHLKTFKTNIIQYKCLEIASLAT